MHTCFTNEFKLRSPVCIVSPSVHSLQTGSHAAAEEHKDQYFSVRFSKTPPEMVSLQLFHQNPALSPSLPTPSTSYLLPSTFYLLPPSSFLLPPPPPPRPDSIPPCNYHLRLQLKETTIKERQRTETEGR